jgi:chemotaxis protein MotB
MAKPDEKQKKVIIIRQIRKGHGGAHGGSWKVAYADFITALMAFFLLMWLLNMTSNEKRAVLALYFKHFSLFDKGGKSFFMDGGMKTMGASEGGQEIVENGEQAKGISDDEYAPRLMSGIEQSAAHDSKQVFMEAGPEGIRIQIVDSAQNPIFAPGGSQMNDSGKRIVRSIASILRSFPNDLAVEGHTDGSQTGNEQVSAWDVSTARALFAQKELEIDGINPTRIVRVTGHGDKMPLFKEQGDPRNRRVSILFIKGKKFKTPERLDWLIKPPG